jgi:hypothetical protein
MSTIQKFEDLECWQLARELNKLVFEYTLKNPFNKDFRFRDQIKAAAGSIMDNISEGFGRGGNKEFINQLTISLGLGCVIGVKTGFQIRIFLR